MKPSDWDLRLPSNNFSGSAKRDRFKVSLFHAATILVLVAFDGLTFSPCYQRHRTVTQRVYWLVLRHYSAGKQKRTISPTSSSKAS